MGADAEPLKLGRKHYVRHVRKVMGGHTGEPKV